MKIRNILFIAIMLMAISGTASADELITDGLVAAYDCQEGTNPSVLYDISGNGHNGTISGGGSYSTEGLILNGSSQYVSLGAGVGNLSTGHTVLIAQNERTIDKSEGALYSRFNYASIVGFKLDKSYLETHDYPYRWTATYCDNVNATPKRIQGVFYQRYDGWSVLQDTYDGNVVKLGFDNRPGIEMSIPNYIDTMAYQTYIGKDSSYYYNGTIGYIAIYDRALSDPELEYMYDLIRDEMATRDVNLIASRNNFSTPYFIMTFDDSIETDYTNAFKVLNDRGISATSYLITGRMGTDIGGSQHLDWNQANYLKSANWDIQDHTYSHSLDITTFTDEELISELEKSNDAFISNGLPYPEHISYPGTNADQRTVDLIKNYRESGRGWGKLRNDVPMVIEWNEPDYWNNTTDWYRIDQTGFTGDYMTESVKNSIDSAVSQGNTLILFTHTVSTPAVEYGCDEATLAEIADYALSQGMEPITIDGFYRAMQGIRTHLIEGSILHGEVTEAAYNKNISYVGFVWGDTRYNNPHNVAPDDSNYSYSWTSELDNYSGSFTHTITTTESKFYYRAAAKVDGVWVYGEELTYDPCLNMPYTGTGLSRTIDENGYTIRYNRLLLASDIKVPMYITPSADTVDIFVSTWTTNSKTWTESSETHDITTSHSIGGFPSNSEIDIYVDGIKYLSPISSSTGYITFDYSGGFSEHDFQAIVATDANLMSDGNAGIVTSSVAMISVVVIVAMVALAIAILKGKAGPELIAPAIIGLLIIMVCIYAMYGIAEALQNAFGY